MADLPGLIEGASNNRGLGHAFLKHTEKAKALALVVSSRLCKKKWKLEQWENQFSSFLVASILGSTKMLNAAKLRFKRATLIAFVLVLRYSP